MNHVLSCYFPSTIVLVDDSPSFLESLCDVLSNENLIVWPFSNQNDALEFINDSSKINFLEISYLKLYNEASSPDSCSSTININMLHDMIYSEDRFSLISAVVADYSMPGMNGVEFLSKIKNPNIQKVLLTGIADEKVAIDAFNDKYINKFVKKDHVNFDCEVLQVIRSSVNQYFSLYSNDLIKYLPSDCSGHLKDPVFANFFHHSCLSKSYTEYYLLDTNGSYLFLTESGQASLLSVTSDNEIDRLIQVAQDSGDAPVGVIEDLQSREYMLIHHSRHGTLPPVYEWGKHFCPARRLEGYKTYFFNFSNSNYLDVDIETIRSYHKFKNRLKS